MQTSQASQISDFGIKTESVDNDYHTNDSVFKRKNVNKYGKIIPAISLLIQLVFIIYTSYLWHTNKEASDKAVMKWLYVICLGVPIISITFFPVYFYTLYYFRSALFKFLIGSLVFGTGTIITAGVIVRDPISISSGSASLVVYLVLIWCFQNKIKLAIVTIKAALVGMKTQISPIFLKFLPFLLMDAILFGLVVICAAQAQILTTRKTTLDNYNKNFEHVSNFVGVVLTIFGYLSLFCCGYFIEILGAVSYIFGAAFFNQTSIKVEQERNNLSKSTTDYSEVTKESSHVAFKTSLGTACLGAFILAIVSSFRQETEQGSKCGNKQLGGAFLSGFMSLVEEFIRFLTTQAYVYSAIYGKGLFDSGKLGFETFKATGFEKYFNYNLTSKILNLMAFLFSASLGVVMFLVSFFGGAGTLYDENFLSDQKTAVSVLYAIIMVLCVFLPFYGINSIISGNAAAQIAIYVENPEIFQKTHSETRKFTKYINS